MKLVRRVPPIVLAVALSGAFTPISLARAQSRAAPARAGVGARAEALGAPRVSTGSPGSAAAPPGAAAPAPAPAGTGADGPSPAPASSAAAASAGVPPRPPPSPLNPTPHEFPATVGAPGPDIEALMSRVTALRSRIAALGAALFSSKLRIELRAPSQDARVKGLRVSLDGGVVYTAPAQATFEQPELVYERPVAAGPHVIAVELERQELARPEYSSWQSSRFVVVVPERRLLWTRLELEGESNMGEALADERAGRYELGVRLEVEVGE